MLDENRTLGSFLTDPRIAPIADKAIAAWDLTEEKMWNQTLRELREAHFGGNIAKGLERLLRAADSGEWFFPLYGEEACREDPACRDASLVFFPSGDPDAGERPLILLVPGGGFVNVWNLTEGWPVAAQFNDLGYHVMILTYRVEGERCLLDREMDDFAQALRLIQNRDKALGLRSGRYITCGFSAGGYLVCLWNVPEKGYAAHGLPRPVATFPVYPLTSWKKAFGDGRGDPEDGEHLFGMKTEKVASSSYEIPDHAGSFPPCALFLAAQDELVSPEHSRLLAESLERQGIPCYLEIGPEGGHGFADGEGMGMAGWTERAVRWGESLEDGKA